MDNIDRTFPERPSNTASQSVSGTIADHDTAKPYRIFGLCLSLIAITVLTVIYAAAASAAVYVAVFGWAHIANAMREAIADKTGDTLLRIAAADLGASLSPMLAASLVVYLALGLAVLTLARWRGGRLWRELIGWHPWPPLKAGRTYWIIAGIAFVYGLAANILVSLYYPPSHDWFTVPKELAPAAMLFFLAAIFAPVTEELLFRGWLYTSLRAQFGMWPGLITSSALFALAHHESSHIYALVVFPIGLALGALRETANSLKASIGFHAFYNTIAYGLAAFDIG